MIEENLPAEVVANIGESIPKWRGIKTYCLPKNEDLPKTITNRLGQKSISLPRIDDKKRWAGYPGISGVSRKVAQLVPKCDYYVEPFAGTAKVFQEVLRRMKKDNTKLVKQFVLNDRSKFVFNWLSREFDSSKVIISKDDFYKCVRDWDSKKTFFLIDQPWFKSSFDQIFSIFTKQNVGEYDKEVLELCQSMKGKFIITTRKENTRILNSHFNHKLIKSQYVVSGHYPRVLITTNLEI